MNYLPLDLVKVKLDVIGDDLAGRIGCVLATRGTDRGQYCLVRFNGHGSYWLASANLDPQELVPRS